MIKDATVSVFKALATHDELLELMSVPVTEVQEQINKGTNEEPVYETITKHVRTVKDIRHQIREERYPTDLLEDNLTRLCVYEGDSRYSITNKLVEVTKVTIDIYVEKEKNKSNRLIQMVAETIINRLDNDKRRLNGLKPLPVGTGLEYSYRSGASSSISSTGNFSKYTVEFLYHSVRI